MRPVLLEGGVPGGRRQGEGAAGQGALQGSGQRGHPHGLLSLVVLEAGLDLAGGPLLHLRVSVRVWGGHMTTV